MNAHLEFLLSAIYDSTRLDHPVHVADLRKSGLTDETVTLQKFTDVPPSMIDQLLGFPAPKVQHAYVLPFADPHGGWMDHVRMKIFPTLETEDGTIKYLQPKRTGARVFFPIAALDQVLHSAAPLLICEGEKKGAAVAQLGLPVVAISGIEGWHLAGARALHPDFDGIPLKGRVVDVLPDADYRTNPNVARAATRLIEALEHRGARPRLVVLPEAA